MNDPKDHVFEPVGTPDAINAAAQAIGYKGTLPSDWLSFHLGEIVRIKGWLFRITKATRTGRMVIEALPQREVEAIAGEALVRIKRRQLVNIAEQSEKLKLEELAGVANTPFEAPPTTPKEEPTDG